MAENPAPQTINVKTERAPSFMDTCCAFGCLSVLILAGLAGCAALFG